MYSFEHLPHSISQQFHNEFLSLDSLLEVFWIWDKTLQQGDKWFWQECARKRSSYVKVRMQNEFLASMGGVFIPAQTKPFTSDEYLREQKVILESTAIRYATVCFSPGQGWQGKENLIWYIKYYTSRRLCSNADFCQSLFHHHGSQAKVKDWHWPLVLHVCSVADSFGLICPDQFSSKIIQMEWFTEHSIVLYF